MVKDVADNIWLLVSWGKFDVRYTNGVIKDFRSKGGQIIYSMEDISLSRRKWEFLH